jgi:hypothetical protein
MDPFNSKVVRGELTFTTAKNETFSYTFTPEELKTVSDRFTQQQLVNLVVHYDNGDKIRPYRFVDSQPEFTFTIDPITGESNVSF